MRTSPDGIEFIKSWEGYRRYPYKDVGGAYTVGYGHLVLSGENYAAGLTKSEAHSLMMEDLQVVEGDIAEHINVELSPNQYDAVSSFFYNIGATKIAAGKNTLPSLNRGDYKAFADHLLSWKNSGGKVVQGLLNRRKAERELFLSGTYVP